MLYCFIADGWINAFSDDEAIDKVRLSLRNHGIIVDHIKIGDVSIKKGDIKI